MKAGCKVILRITLFTFSNIPLYFAVLAPLLVVHPAAARPEFLNQFKSFYPTSMTSQAGCATCHGQAIGGPPWNAYGRDLRANGGQVGAKGNITSALLAVELLNSDSIGGNNAAEIASSTQPGWCETSTPGCNNSIYDANGSNIGSRAPPGGIKLDDESPPGPGEEPPPAPSDGLVDLSGEVQSAQGTSLCAMVLASGMFQFSCEPNGPFALNNLPREIDGTVKRQVYVDGFFPTIDVLQGSTNEIVVMRKAGACPEYNSPYNGGGNPESAGDRIDIAGRILLQESDTPVCAMVLANGEFLFSCDGTGNYSLNIPLDGNGQFKLQVYADGFAPKVQTFDEFKRINDVRLARASECN